MAWIPLLWCRPAATVPIQPLAWKPPYAMDMALKRPKKKKMLIIDCKESRILLRFGPENWKYFTEMG